MAKTIIRVNSENILDLDIDTRNHTLSGNIIDEVNNTLYPVGGGGGDFTTATVEFIRTDQPDGALDLQVVVIDPESSGVHMIQAFGGESAEVVLYKDHSYPDFTADISKYSSSGNIEINVDDSYIDITGAGTITYNGS